jgi:hypothetical protein
VFWFIAACDAGVKSSGGKDGRFSEAFSIPDKSTASFLTDM